MPLPAKKDKLDRFYTTREQSARCVEIIRDMTKELFGKALLFEPSAGDGAFFELFPHDRRFGIDIDTTTTTGEVTSKEEWNRTIDTRLFERLGLDEGTHIRADRLCRLVRDRLYPTGTVEGSLIFHIWREASREKTESRARNLLHGLALYLGESMSALP